jgi:hypothetical protein
MDTKQLTKSLSRFDDLRINDFCELGQVKSGITHYGGEQVEDRMAQIRTQVEFIRHNWETYSQFNSELRHYLLNNNIGPQTKEFKHALRTLTEKKRDWNDESSDYGALRLYTSQYGYDFIFSSLNAAFRAQDLPSRVKEIRSCVFLIELLNIDLFHWQRSNPDTQNFSGTVYRGMTLSENAIHDFKCLSLQGPRERFWAIPLSIMSASTKLDQAIEFTANQVGENDSLHPLLLRIHVESLGWDTLEMYSKHFPTSIVTSLCAVPIASLSDFEDEAEVLLRGPFFHLVRLQQEELEGFGRIHVMDTVMITGNRDHPSTQGLKEREYNIARDLFAALNWMARMQKCAALATEFGLEEDASAYRQIYLEEIQKSDKCLRAIVK